MSRFQYRTARRWLSFILCTSGLRAQTCLVLSPPTLTADGSALLDLALYSPPGAAPAAVQWTFQYPSSSIVNLTVDDGPRLIAAGKTAICSGNAASYNCLAVGLNQKTIGNGVIAKLTAVLAPGAQTAPILITDSRAASPAGKLIPISLRIQSVAGAKVSSDCKLHTPPGGAPDNK